MSLRKSVDEYIAGLDSTQAAVVASVRALVFQAAPDAVESVKWAQPVWEVNGPVCSAKAFKNYTNVNFWRGAELAERADSERLLLGQGGKMRHLRIASPDEVRAEALVRLVTTAADLNRRFGDPTRGEATRAID